jgi:NAD/NADP transhydrogenase beta subunit
MGVGYEEVEKKILLKNNKEMMIGDEKKKCDEMLYKMKEE